MKIIIDFQETKNRLPEHLEDIETEVKKLEVGDFIVSKDVVVERKTVSDFVNSLIDKRLFNQARNMRENYPKPIFLIEGELKDMFIRQVPDRALLSAMVSLVLKYDMRFLFSSSEEETAELLSILAEKEQVEKEKEIALRCKKKKLDFKQKQQFFLEGLPGVGPKLANNLLKKFGSPRKVINAPKEELMKVDKIGPKKAKLIQKIIKNKKG